MTATPRDDGFRMPAEFAPHQGTLMAWPARTVGMSDWWAGHLDQAKDDWAADGARGRGLRAGHHGVPPGIERGGARPLR